VLKNKLSAYVRLAAGGETVLVTDRNKVVAELVPPQPGRSALSEDEFIAQGVREGWITPATRRGKGPPPTGAPIMTLEEILRDLDEARADSWDDAQKAPDDR
jgi:antitoxin (DNA-binding transcriptional repressor) of toxin-antitoxin stability system